MHWSEYSRFGVSLFVLLGPILKVPLLLSLVGGADHAVILRSATVATATALSILLVSQFVGEWILIATGTSLPAFQIAGGLIILLTGLSLVQGMLPEPEKVKAEHTAALAFRVGVTPIGTPALAGAGSITAVILETHDLHSPIDDFVISMIIVANCLLAWAILATAPSVSRFLGRNGLLVVQRIFGLLVVASGVQIVITGVGAHMATLAKHSVML